MDQMADYLDCPKFILPIVNCIIFFVIQYNFGYVDGKTKIYYDWQVYF